MFTELTNTHGILYAIAYWISAMLYCRFLPKRAAGMKRCLLAAFFFVLIFGFITLIHTWRGHNGSIEKNS